MKTKYPLYAKGELQAVKKKLSSTEKTILKDFLKECSITAGEHKVKKIERVILQFKDIVGKLEVIKQDVDSFLVLLMSLILFHV